MHISNPWKNICQSTLIEEGFAFHCSYSPSMKSAFTTTAIEPGESIGERFTDTILSSKKLFKSHLLYEVRDQPYDISLPG